MGVVVARHDEDLVGRPAPVRAESDGVLGCLDHAVFERLLGRGRGADHATAREALETRLFVGKLPGHERDAEQLAVGVGDRGTGLATVVDDHLAVTQASVCSRAPRPGP